MQPFAEFNNEFVWMHLMSGRSILCPRSCPKPVFSQLMEPCFAVVPTERVSFATLCKVLQALIDKDSSETESLSSALNLTLSSSAQDKQPDFPSAAFSVTSHGSAHTLDKQGYVDSSDVLLQETKFHMHTNPLFSRSANNQSQHRAPNIPMLQLANGYVMSNDGIDRDFQKRNECGESSTT